MRNFHNSMAMISSVILLLSWIVMANWPLSHVEYSTYIWWSSQEYYLKYTHAWLERDAQWNIYIAWSSPSDDFPTTLWSLQEDIAGWYDDCGW